MGGGEERREEDAVVWEEEAVFEIDGDSDDESSRDCVGVFALDLNVNSIIGGSEAAS